MLENLFIKVIKSEYARAWILAQLRHWVTAVGASLVLKGYVDDSTVQAAAGFVVALVGFYLAANDVKKVDEKITVALHTPTPQGLTPEQEAEVTKLLNKLQTIKPGVSYPITS